MVQGDKYQLSFQIKKDNTVITNQNCDGVKVLLGDVVYSSDDSEVTYDSTTQKWSFMLTQAESLKLCENAPYQAQVKIGTSIFSSSVKRVTVDRGAIKEVWS